MGDCLVPPDAETWPVQQGCPRDTGRETLTKPLREMADTAQDLCRELAQQGAGGSRPRLLRPVHFPGPSLMPAGPF